MHPVSPFVMAQITVFGVASVNTRFVSLHHCQKDVLHGLCVLMSTARDVCPLLAFRVHHVMHPALTFGSPHQSMRDKRVRQHVGLIIRTELRHGL